MWWKEHLGERSKASVSWDRTGAQTFPLLAKGDWSTVALFGQSGRIEISDTGTKSIPIDSLGFGYRVMGEDLSIDLDINGTNASVAFPSLNDLATITSTYNTGGIKECATKTGAEILGRDHELGTLETGKLADILVVEGDVVADITILEDRQKLIAVMQGGIVKAGQLMQPKWTHG